MMRARMVRLTIALLLAACPMSANAEQTSQGTENSTATISLELTCVGGGEATKHHSATAFAAGSEGSAWGSEIYTTESSFQDQVDVRLFSGNDRIRLPRHMLPLIHGGDNGWIKLSEIIATERDITASADVNLANHPKVRIDRVTGVINIVGKAGNYVGDCRKFDPQVEKPKF